MPKDIKFDLTDYDGGFPFHPEPREKGTLLLKGGKWEVHFKGTKQYIHGGLNRYEVEASPAEKGCRVALIDSQDEKVRGSFSLPRVSAEQFARQHSEFREAARQEIAAEQQRNVAIQGGAWWLTPGAFKGLGFGESCSVSETKYLGGWSGHPNTHGGTNILRIDKTGVNYRGFKTIFTIPWSHVAAIEVEGPEQAQKRVTVSRALTLGIFALAAKKTTKMAVVVVQTRSGEEACFQTESITAPELRAKLTPISSHMRTAATRLVRPSTGHAATTPKAAIVSPPPAPSPPASLADELKKLADLRDAGVLTEEEFVNQKAKLLA